MKKQNNWEGEFEEFLIDLGDKENIYWHGATSHSIDHNGDFLNEIIKKVRQLLQEQREMIIEMAEGMKKEMTTTSIPCPDCKPGCAVYHTKTMFTPEDKNYNQAIQDLINYLKDEK